MGREHDIHDYAASSFLAVVVKHCGADAAARLCAAHGGLVVGVPKYPRAHHALCEVLGVDGVKRIVAEWGSGRVSVLLGRRLRAQILFADGRSASEVARDLGVSYRTASRYRRALRPSDSNL
ncbi:helix-turn-helix domain-containing protein [Phenylobacterium sp.]|uniref:helix-turn-helix domain-containing protein n=1 Tax=Phenylobacterium sp. TaxID=1871053 RepID=UPI0039C8F374